MAIAATDIGHGKEMTRPREVQCCFRWKGCGNHFGITMLAKFVLKFSRSGETRSRQARLRRAAFESNFAPQHREAINAGKSGGANGT